MKPKNCLVFGASGQIGRNLIRKLTKNNYKVTAVTRNFHKKAYILKTQANPGYIDIVETNIFDENSLRKLIKHADICINLIGILNEKGKVNTFDNIHEKLPYILSKLCSECGVKQFIHMSSLGVDEAKDSKYALSKLNGEKLIKKNYNNATILRPSVVFSVDDNFTTNFMTILSKSPIFPLFYNGKTKFVPIHCSDLTEIIFQIINKNIISTVIECVGPETITLKDILKRLLNLIEKRRLLIPVPLTIAKIMSFFLEFLPNPMITLDQLKLLNYNNVPSGKFKTNFDLNLPSYSNFDFEVEKYCFIWKEAGQFSQAKYKKNN